MHTTTIHPTRNPLKQFKCIKFPLRKVMALRGHTELEGNLPQLLKTWAGSCPVIERWLEEGNYMSHDIINEQVSLKGQKILRSVPARINDSELTGMPSSPMRQPMLPGTHS